MDTFVTDAKNPPPRSALDRILRRFARISYHLFITLAIGVGALAIGLALAPALAVWRAASSWSAGFSWFGRYTVQGLGFSAAFFVFGFALLVIVPIQG